MPLCREMKWRPCDVDDLAVGEFLAFCSMMDELARDARKSRR